MMHPKIIAEIRDVREQYGFPIPHSAGAAESRSLWCDARDDDPHSECAAGL
jgi:hypothetical protein